jgi:hypothetical protein
MTVPNGRPQLSVDITRADDDPQGWARRREDQGRTFRGDYFDVNITVELFVSCSAAAGGATRARSAQLGDSFAGEFFGPPEKVAEPIRQLAELGIGRV